MARFQLIAGFALAAALPLAAQEKATPNPAGRPFNLGPRAQKEAAKGGQEVQNVLKALEALTPEQQAKFKDNFIKWMNMPPEEKREMRKREENRKQRMAEEIDSAIEQSGLKLEAGQRGKYAKRYAEERRKIEETLRKETEDKRKPMVNTMLSQLRVEFSGTAPVATTPAPPQP